MPRPRRLVPTYRLHRPRNCGKVVVDGQTVYFPGPFGSDQSLAAYNEWLTSYLRTGSVKADPLAAASIQALVVQFTEQFVLKRYQKNGQPTSEVRSFKVALRSVNRLFATRAAASFTPRDLIACRQSMVEDGICRKRINQHLSRIRRCFRWGVQEGMVPEHIWRALGAVDGLRRGEVPDRPPVADVAEASVWAVEPFVTPPVWAAIQLQFWTAARPGEILAMRTRDVQEYQDGLLIYTPESHKTEHHGRRRVVLLGPKARAVLEPWLRPDDPDAYLFSPAEARRWFDAKRAAEGKTHRRTPNQKKSPRRKPGARYSVNSYDHAIRRACTKAGVACWHPHQLRHTAATRIRKQFGLDAAQVALGHSHAKVSEVYAEADLARAALAASRLG